MDLFTLAFEIAFIGAVAAAGGLLLLTYLAFARMNKDVRRARMFIMADRVKRFLGAFTLGFLLIAAASILTIAGLPTAALVFPVVIFLFLGAIVYGSLELFLIVRPRRSRLPFAGRLASRSAPGIRPATAPSEPPAEDDLHAVR